MVLLKFYLKTIYRLANFPDLLQQCRIFNPALPARKKTDGFTGAGYRVCHTQGGFFLLSTIKVYPKNKTEEKNKFNTDFKHIIKILLTIILYISCKCMPYVPCIHVFDNFLKYI